MTDKFTTTLVNFTKYCLGTAQTSFSIPRFEVATAKDMEGYTREMHQAQSALHASGKIARLTAGKGFVALTYDRLTLRVQVEKAAKHTNVTETSRNAYHSTDFSTQEKRIAAFIFLHTKDGGDVTRAEIANRIGVQEGRVAARVNALLKEYGQGGYTSPHGNYRLVLTGKRLSKYAGASDKPNEALRFEKCEPAPESGAQQLDLF
jgi:hypothetical protein